MSQRILGTEVLAYQTSVAPTGVPLVMRETHRHLVPLLSAREIGVVPVIATDRPMPADRRPSAYVTSDPILGQRPRRPDEVDALLMLDPLSNVDVAALTRIRQNRRLPVIVMINDLLPMRHPEWFHADAGRAFRLQLQRLLHVADHVVVPSHHVHEDLMDLGWPLKPRIHVLHLGTSFAQQPPVEAPAGVIRLLYVSTLAARKGHATLLDAFDLLVEDGRDVELVLVGRVGWEIDDVLSRIRRHPEYRRSLRWLEHGDDEAVQRLMSESTVGVIPAEGEGFGLFLEEALSAGLVVVASDLPVFRERPYPNVVFAGPGAQGLADAMVEASRKRARPLADGAVRTMQDFSVDLSLLITSAMEE